MADSALAADLRLFFRFRPEAVGAGAAGSLACFVYFRLTELVDVREETLSSLDGVSIDPAEFVLGGVTCPNRRTAVAEFGRSWMANLSRRYI